MPIYRPGEGEEFVPGEAQEPEVDYGVAGQSERYDAQEAYAGESEGDYWNNPAVVARYYEAKQATPDWQAPEWLGDDGAQKIDAAYKWFGFRNEGKPWYQQQALAADDQGLDLLRSIPEPPPEQRLSYEPTQKVQPQTQPEQQFVDPYAAYQKKVDDWNLLEPWQRVASTLTNAQPFAGRPDENRLLAAGWQGTLAGIGGAVVGSLAGPWGAAIGGLGVGLPTAYQAYTGTEIPGIASLLTFFNIPAEFAKRVVGVGYQADLKDIDTVLKSLPEAWQAGAVTYETSDNKIPVLSTIFPNLSTDVLNAMAKASGDQPAGPNEIWNFAQGYKEPVPILPSAYTGKSLRGAEALDEVRQLLEKVPGTDAPDASPFGVLQNLAELAGNKEVVDFIRRLTPSEEKRKIQDEYRQRFGDTGIANDLIGQTIIDPLNMAGQVGGRAAGLAADIAGKPSLGKAFRATVGNPVIDALPFSPIFEAMSGGAAAAIRAGGRVIGSDTLANAKGLRGSTGLLGGFKQYGEEVRNIALEKARTPDAGARPDGVTQPKEYQNVSELDWFDRLAGGITKEGKIKDLENTTRTGILGYRERLNALLPEAKASLYLSSFMDNLGRIVNDIDTDKSLSNVERAQAFDKAVQMYARVNDVEVGTAAEALLRSPMTQTTGVGIRDFVTGTKYNEMKAAFLNGNIQKAIGVLESNAKELGIAPAKLLEDIKMNPKGVLDSLAALGSDTGARIKSEIEAGRMTPDVLADQYAVFNKDGVPWNFGQWRATVMNEMADASLEWVKKNYGVKEDSTLNRFAGVLKTIQSAALLDLSPSYAINNVINNMVTRAAQGIFGYMTANQVDSFWERMGSKPVRIDEGIGPAGTPEGNTAGGAYARAMADLRTATMGDGNLAKMINQVNKARNKLGVMAKISKVCEQNESSQAFTIATQMMWDRLWRPGRGYDKLPAQLEVMLRQIDPRAPEFVYAAINGGMNPEEIEARLWKPLIEINVEQVIDRAVERIIPDNPDLGRSLLTMTGLTGELKKALRNAKNGNEIDHAFDVVKGQVQDLVDKKVIHDITNIREEIANKVQNEGFQAVSQLFTEMQERIWRRWLEHYRDMHEFIESVRTMPKELVSRAWRQKNAQESRSWQRVNDFELQIYAGILEKIGLNTPEAQRMIGLIDDRLMTYRDFFDGYDVRTDTGARITAVERATLPESLVRHEDGKNDIYRKFFDGEYAKEGRNLSFHDIEKQANSKFDETFKRAKATQTDVDALFAGMFGDEASKAQAMDWRQRVGAIQDEMDAARTAFRNWLTDNRKTLSQDQVDASWEKFINDKYIPYINRLKMEEIKGMQDLGGEPGKKITPPDITTSPETPVPSPAPSDVPPDVLPPTGEARPMPSPEETIEKGEKIIADAKAAQENAKRTYDAMLDRDQVLGQIQLEFRAKPEEMSVVKMLLENAAEQWGKRTGRRPEEWYGAWIAGVERGGEGESEGKLRQITPEQAMKTNVPVSIPEIPELLDAIKNTASTSITIDGILIRTIRYQKQEQEGAYSSRTGVFYLAAGDKNTKYYRGDNTLYGGNEKFEGDTLLRKPFATKGATGGKAPENAYDAILGKGAYERMRNEVLGVKPYGNEVATIKNIETVLSKYNADPSLASDIYQNSREGNTLYYAIQENIVAHALRNEGYDSIIGYSKRRDGTHFISEIFDLREITYPTELSESVIHNKYLFQKDLTHLYQLSPKDATARRLEEATRVAGSHGIQDAAEAEAILKKQQGGGDVDNNKWNAAYEYLKAFQDKQWFDKYGDLSEYDNYRQLLRERSLDPIYRPKRLIDPIVRETSSFIDRKDVTTYLVTERNSYERLGSFVTRAQAESFITNRGIITTKVPNGWKVYYGSGADRVFDTKAKAQRFIDGLKEGEYLYQEHLELDVLAMAHQYGIATATKEGNPNNIHLVNIVKKYGGEEAKGIKGIKDVTPEMAAKAFEARRIDKGEPAPAIKDTGIEPVTKGSINFLEDGRAVITAFKGADISTFVHEIGHVFRRGLDDANMRDAGTWVNQEALRLNELRRSGKLDNAQLISFFSDGEGGYLKEISGVRENGSWTRAAEEIFARGFERWLAGEIAIAPPAVIGVFEKLRTWMLNIYKGITGTAIDVEITPEIRQVFERMLFDEDQIAARREGASVLSKRQSGSETFAFNEAGGESYRFRFRLVDLDELNISHSDTFQPNEGYPKELQPRMRERGANVDQVDHIARELDAERMLLDTHALDRGSPIIGSDMVVENGNGRALALRRAANLYPERYEGYRQYLTSHFPEFGLSPQAMEGIAKPVLVRERIGNTDRVKFVKEAGQAPSLGMSTVEQALIDVNVITDAMLKSILVTEGQTIDQALRSTANNGLVQKFVSTIPEVERANVMDAERNLSIAGINRLKNALFAKVYTGEDGQRLLTLFAESAEPVVKNVENAIYGSLGSIAAMEGAIASGQRSLEYSLSKDIASVVDVYSRLKQNGKMSVEDYLKQMPLFGGELSPLQKKLMAFINENGRSAKKIREFVNEYSRLVLNQQSPDQGGLFGEIKPPTKDELLDIALKGEDGAQPGGALDTLFQKSNRMKGQGDIFSGSAVDLPLFSGTPVSARGEIFAPKEAAPQLSMFPDIVPEAKPTRIIEIVARGEDSTGYTRLNLKDTKGIEATYALNKDARVSFRILDTNGKVLREGKGLDDLFGEKGQDTLFQMAEKMSSEDAKKMALDLQAEARRQKDAYLADIEEVANKTGHKFDIVKAGENAVKEDVDRMITKIVDKSWSPTESYLSDALRATILVDTPEQYKEVQQAMVKKGYQLWVNPLDKKEDFVNRYTDEPPGGYKDVNFKWVKKGGDDTLPKELLVITHAMYAAKDRLRGHDMYKITRKADEIINNGGSLLEHQEPVVNSLRIISGMLYDAALAVDKALLAADISADLPAITNTLNSFWDNVWPEDFNNIAISFKDILNTSRAPNIANSLTRSSDISLASASLELDSLISDFMGHTSTSSIAETGAESKHLGDASTLKQAAEPVKPVNNPMGSTPVSLWEGELFDEAYRSRIAPLLDSIKAEAKASLKEKAFKMTDLPEDVARELRKYTKLVVSQDMPGTKMTATRFGEMQRDMALLNYQKRYGFDNMLNIVFPYQFWYTRSMVNWAQRMVDKPAIYSMYVRLREMQKKYEQKGIPTRMRNKMRVAAPYLPEWAGGSIYFDPLKQIFPFDQFGAPFQFMNNKSSQQNTRAIELMRDQQKDGSITSTEMQQAMTEKKGYIWESAWRQAGSEMENGMSNPMVMAQMMMQPAMYLTAPYYAMSGQKEKIGTLPPTRLAGGIETMLQDTPLQGLGKLVGTVGAGPERWARNKLGMSEFGEFGDYYVDRQLANMTADGGLAPKDAIQAMIERSGPAYDEAYKRVQMEQALRVPGLLPIAAIKGAVKGEGNAGDVAGSLAAAMFPAGIMSKGETILRGFKDEYDAAWVSYNNGDKTKLTQFYEDHPEYEARMMQYKDPEKRLRNFLSGEIWDRYYELDGPNKTMIRNALGEQFQQVFLDKSIADATAVDLETMAYWAAMLGGVVPKTDTTKPVLERPLYERQPVETFPVTVNDKMQAFWDKREQLYPNIQAVEQEYFNQGRSKAVLTQFPELKEYWDWKKQYYKDNPEVEKYAEYKKQEYPVSYGGERAVIETSRQTLTMQDFEQYDDALLRQLYGYVYAGQPLSKGAKDELYRIWMKSGQPGGTFPDYINLVYDTMGGG